MAGELRRASAKIYFRFPFKPGPVTNLTVKRRRNQRTSEQMTSSQTAALKAKSILFSPWLAASLRGFIGGRLLGRLVCPALVSNLV
jgi:hypothetical protein